MAAAIIMAGQMHGRLMDCSLAESLPKRSAVVTRRSEPAMTRIPAGYCKVSVSDAAQIALFIGEAKELREHPRSLTAFCGTTRTPDCGTYG